MDLAERLLGIVKIFCLAALTFAEAVLHQGTIGFGNLAATRKLCADTLMVQEQRFLKALSEAKRLDLTHEGQILLIYADGTEPTLRFSRIVDK